MQVSEKNSSRKLTEQARSRTPLSGYVPKRVGGPQGSTRRAWCLIIRHHETEVRKVRPRQLWAMRVYECFVRMALGKRGGGVDEQHEQFLRAVYDARTPRGHAFISDL